MPAASRRISSGLRAPPPLHDQLGHGAGRQPRCRDRPSATACTVSSVTVANRSHQSCSRLGARGEPAGRRRTRRRTARGPNERGGGAASAGSASSSASSAASTGPPAASAAVAVAALRPARAAPGELVQDHVARAAVEADHGSLAASRGGDRGEVGDPADVQGQHRDAGPGQQPAIDDRDQGRAAAAGGDVVLAEVADHRAAEPLGQHRRLADLQGGHAMLVRHGLAMAADEVRARRRARPPARPPRRRTPRRPPGSAAPARARRRRGRARSRAGQRSVPRHGPRPQHLQQPRLAGARSGRSRRRSRPSRCR